MTGSVFVCSADGTVWPSCMYLASCGPVFMQFLLSRCFYYSWGPLPDLFWCLINTNYVCYGVIIFALPDWFEDGSWRNHESIFSRQGRFLLHTFWSTRLFIYFFYRRFGLKDAHGAKGIEELPISQINKKIDAYILNLCWKLAFNAVTSGRSSLEFWLFFFWFRIFFSK